MKSFVIIGLGRFGTAIAGELSALGHEVLAVDVDEERVQQVADHVTHAVTGDGRNIEVLRALGVRNFDCVVVAMGSDVGNSALITLNLKELGVKEVICKAQSHVHSRVLEKIGADRVVFPEYEMGAKLAQGLSSSNVLNFIELSEDYGAFRTPVLAGEESAGTGCAQPPSCECDRHPQKRGTECGPFSRPAAGVGGSGGGSGQV